MLEWFLMTIQQAYLILLCGAPVPRLQKISKVRSRHQSSSDSHSSGGEISNIVWPEYLIVADTNLLQKNFQKSAPSQSTERIALQTFADLNLMIFSASASSACRHQSKSLPPSLLADWLTWLPELGSGVCSRLVTTPPDLECTRCRCSQHTSAYASIRQHTPASPLLIWSAHALLSSQTLSGEHWPVFRITIIFTCMRTCSWNVSFPRFFDLSFDFSSWKSSVFLNNFVLVLLITRRWTLKISKICLNENPLFDAASEILSGLISFLQQTFQMTKEHTSAKNMSLEWLLWETVSKHLNRSAYPGYLVIRFWETRKSSIKSVIISKDQHKSRGYSLAHA